MSFPPRPPMIPPMMTGAYYPMGMVPMGMRIMGAPQPTIVRPVVNSQKQPKKLVPQEIPKDDKNDKPPVTTVFVGNISDKAPDVMIKQMLQRCGNVLSWKRVQGASGKLQAFGFCEYEEPEATLRCIRLLNDWYIPDKKLVVKVDAKTKTLLDDYRQKKKAAEITSEEKKEKEKKEEENGDKENGEIRDDDSSADELDEFTKREDRVATAGLEAIMMEYSAEVNKAMAAAPHDDKKSSKVQMIKEGKDVKDVGLDGLEVEEETKFIINREIRSFRDLHKDEEIDKEKEEREQERRNEEARRRRERERDRERERERERAREKEKSRREEQRLDKRRDRHSRTKSRSRSPVKSRNFNRRDRDIERSRSPERSRRKEQELEDEEEAKERRKLEKKLREKEAAYKERLTNWEARERKKARENGKEKDREEDRKIEESREGRRLKEFLEDYDDLRDDPKFFKGSALSRRMKEREKEKEADARDRQREKEEFDEIKRRLMSEGHPDPEAELARMERERNEHLKPQLQIQEIVISPSNSNSPEPKELSDSDKGSHKMASTLKPVEPSVPVSNNNNNTAASPLSDDDDNTMFSFGGNEDVSEDSQQPAYSSSAKTESSKIGFSSLKLGTNNNSPAEVPPPSTKRKKLTVGDVFNQDEDSSDTKKRKLIPLDYDEEKKAANSAEEKRNKIKILIDSIPTAKEELFAFQLDWSIVDQPLMDKRIKPWINKKIVEYIGEEEPTLTDFICQKVIARSTPASIQNDVAMVLDEEAEVFVVKMWRLLVYETEAKKLGLVK